MTEPTTPAGEPAPTPPVAPSASAPTSPWVWVAFALSIIALVCSIVVPIAAVAIFGWFTNSDGGDDSAYSDEPVGMYYVDQESVISAVRRPCEAADDAAVKIRPDEAAPRLSKGLTAWTTQARLIVKAIDSAHPNSDSRAWRDQWRATISAVDKFAAHVGQPGNRLTLPDAVGDMYWNTDAECGVPVSIAALDPAYGTSFYAATQD